MTDMLLEFLLILAIDAVFIGLCALALLPLAIYKKAAFAVLKRNFIGYFMNPTGYIFLCLFVFLTSLAAFYPHEFFNAKLASLHQLNKFLPYIMLVFIPAITMSVWSEERRQGTDELLLTLPAGDFDIVIGKYLAAAAIFTCSLIFAQISHYAMLIALTLGQMDTGLLCATYFGYWLTGLAMLAIGMVASFMTKNLTVGFILGALFNAPLVFAALADTIVWSWLARGIAYWSISARFEDFGRGVISLSSTIFFVMIVVVGLYVSVVLIGTRHWFGGRESMSLIGHFLLRTLSLIVIAVSVTVFFANHDLRYDTTEGRVSSLSPDTIKLLRNLEPEHPIVIHAFISEQVPQDYVQTQYNMRSLLKEFASYSGDIQLRMYDNLKPYSDEAKIAEERFGVIPQTVRTRSQGVFKDEKVYLGAAFTSGLEKVVVPFFEYGVPVEYELIRSVSTVAKAKRPELGILRTDAQLFSMPTFQGGQMQSTRQEMIIDELEKQYDVEQVDATAPIEVGQFDVLMVVQPSSLDPTGMQNLVTAIQAGQPTAIFEDPRPTFLSAPATGEPRTPPMMGMMGMGQQELPKGDIALLWDTLGIDPPVSLGGMRGPQPDLVWQAYNPYPKLRMFDIPDTWVFASNAAPGGENAINQEDEISRGIEQIFFPNPGMIEKKSGANDLELTPLVSTGTRAGRLSYSAFMQNNNNPYTMKIAQGQPLEEPLLLAARIRSLGDEDAAAGDEQDEQTADSSDENGEDNASSGGGINVIYVADIDLMMSAFLQIRARPTSHRRRARRRIRRAPEAGAPCRAFPPTHRRL
jgi:ABC-2 type transport system permease protein